MDLRVAEEFRYFGKAKACKNPGAADRRHNGLRYQTLAPEAGKAAPPISAAGKDARIVASAISRSEGALSKVYFRQPLSTVEVEAAEHSLRAPPF